MPEQKHTDAPHPDTGSADVGPADGPATGPATGPASAESLFEAPPMAEQERMVEAILFASTTPVTVAELNARLPHGCDTDEALAHLRIRYRGRGVNLVKVENTWAMRTAPDLGFLMRHESVETRKLSRAAIETLAIIAYHQPATRAEIEEIRGVSVSRGTVDQLLELEWIRFGRRRMTPGRPVTFVVTQVFLDHFGLENVRDLPGLADLRAAGLLENRPPPGDMPRIGAHDADADADDNYGDGGDYGGDQDAAGEATLGQSEMFDE